MNDGVPVDTNSIVSEIAPMAQSLATEHVSLYDQEKIYEQEKGASQEKDRLVYYRGRQGSIGDVSDNSGDFGDRTLRLNFVDAPTSEVVRSIVNDIFGETIFIADGAEGRITLTSPEPVPFGVALNTLETALAESGLALLKKPSGYLLTSFQEANSGSHNQSPAQPTIFGFSATIVPIKHASPLEIVRLTEPFISNRLVLKPDNEQGFIVIQGPQSDAREAIKAIQTFDVPFLTDRIFGMFEIRYSSAQTIKSEIESVMGLAGGQNGGAIEIIAMPRLNQLFVIARDKSDFNDVQGWIERLDRSSGGDERRLRYYIAQNTPASALAQQLSSVFGVGSAQSLDSTVNAESNSALGVQSAVYSAIVADKISIVPDELNNALIIRATDTEYREILDLLYKMDVLAPQVLIEATIAEVTLTDDLRFGVRWAYEKGKSSSILSDTGAVGAVFPGFSYTYLGANIRAALSTLASLTDVTVLSAPSIMVQNNQSANLQVGDEVPIVTQQATSVIGGEAPIVSTIQLRNTGVILEVKPRINASDVVVLDITQEVSDVVPTTTSGIDSPTIQQRRFTSTVAVRNGATVALGGLIRETQSDNQSGIPLLKDIPGLGNIFKSRDTTTRRTELMIFLTPKIIRGEDDARNVLEYLRNEMAQLSERIKGVPHISE